MALKNIKSIYDTAVLVSGPMMDEHWSIHRFLVERVDTVVSIGDGVREITSSPTKGEYYEAIHSLDVKMMNALSKILVILSAHGYTEGSKHYLHFGNKFSPSTAAIFEDFAKIYPQSEIDFFIISCFGGAAVSDLEALPEGARIFILSGAEEEAISTNSDATINNFPTNWTLSLDNMFYNHLLEMRVFEKPSLIQQDSILAPFKYFKDNLHGKNLTAELTTDLYKKIAKICKGKANCNESLAGKLEDFSSPKLCIPNTINSCESMRDEEGVGNYQLLSLLIQESQPLNGCDYV